MEHGEEADGGSQQSRIGGSFEQRLGGATKQDFVNLSWILKRQPADLGGQREDDVEIGDGQKLGLALRQPAGASLGLALGTVPVAARVI